MIDLTINKENLERNIEKARENKIVIPTYEQMKHPETIPDKIKDKLLNVGLWDVDPLNLFRITWKNEQKASGGLFGKPNFIELPKELTGVNARIICLIGKRYRFKPFYKVKCCIAETYYPLLKPSV